MAFTPDEQKAIENYTDNDLIAAIGWLTRQIETAKHDLDLAKKEIVRRHQLPPEDPNAPRQLPIDDSDADHTQAGP